MCRLPPVIFLLVALGRHGGAGTVASDPNASGWLVFLLRLYKATAAWRQAWPGLAATCKMDLEGIVSKRRDSAYRSGRSRAWVKARTRRVRRSIAFVSGFGEGGEQIGRILINRAFWSSAFNVRYDRETSTKTEVAGSVRYVPQD